MTLSATAADSDGTIARVEFYNDRETLLNSDTAAPYSFTWWSVPGRRPCFREGHLQQQRRQRDVGHGLRNGIGGGEPTADGDADVAGQRRDVYRASKRDAECNGQRSDGTISRVEFYNGTTLLNTDTAAPYSFAWSSVPAGTYSRGKAPTTTAEPARRRRRPRSPSQATPISRRP